MSKDENLTEEEILSRIIEVARKFGAVCAILLDKKNIRKGNIRIGLLFDRQVEKDLYHKIFSELLEKLSVEKDNLIIDILDNAPIILVYNYLKEGQMLFCDDEEKFKRFKATKISQYLEIRDEMRIHTTIPLKESESLSE
ncbi:MAG: hypothetical protein ACTSX9_01260 [Candidatus Njordarchaeales archaeon]